MAKRTWVRTVSSAPLTTIYAYNNAGELNSTDYSDSTPDVAITHTRFGAQKAVTDATGTRTFTYTAALRPDQEQLPAFYGDRILTRSYQFGLDLESAPLSVPGRSDGFELGLNGDPAPAPEYSVVYGYDTAGRLDSVTDKNGGYSYTYTSNSNLRSTLTSPVHVATTTYEPYRNVIDIVENTVGTTTVSKFDYLVNSLGQRTQRANTGTAFGTTSTDDFTYNAKGEVESATNATLTARNQSFAYDDIGNRLTFTTTGGTTNYTANGLNQYTAIASSTPAYDPDGNQTSTGLGQAYIWDAENRLIVVEPLIPGTGDKKVINTYDAQSRRVRRAVFTYTSGAWALTTDEKFIYDGWNVVAVLNAASSNALLRTYTWGLDLSGSLQGAGGVGGLLSTKDDSSVYHYTYDANGNVSEVLDHTGAVVGHYEYDAFGDSFVASGAYALVNEYRFSTKPLDAASGLYYYGFRYYNPSTGRWPSRDPIEERGGLNLYGMVGNNAVNFIDPYGLDRYTDRHPKGSCGPGKTCSENFDILKAYLLSINTRLAEDFTDAFRALAERQAPHPSPNYPTYTHSWNGHVKQVWQQFTSATKCLVILKKQIDEGKCCPPGPGKTQYDVYYNYWTRARPRLPGEIAPTPLQSLNNSILNEGGPFNWLVNRGLVGPPLPAGPVLAF